MKPHAHFSPRYSKYSGAYLADDVEQVVYFRGKHAEQQKEIVDAENVEEGPV
jgi:hypothetical protein